MTDYQQFAGEAPAQVVADVCGVDVATVRRWRSGQGKPHPLAEKVLRFTLRGDAAAIFGREWVGVTISRDGLQLPGWRGPIPVGELRAAFWRLQQVESLERERARLAHELEQARAAVEAAEELAAWYRRQLVGESRLALMLSCPTD